MSIDKLTDKLAEIVATLQGPGLEVAREAARTEAFSALRLDLALTICGVLLARKGLSAFRADKGIDDGFTLAWMIAGGFGAVFAFFGIVALADPWLWTTMVHPEQWLAKKVLGL